MPEPVSDMNRNQEVGVGYFGDFYSNEEPLEINMRNLENLSLLDNLQSVGGLGALENNENNAFFQDYDPSNGSSFLTDADDSKEPNVSRTVRVPTSEHVAEIVGRQGCKIKDLRARTNTYIKTPMRTEPPVFVVTGKETAVSRVIAEINNAAEHFTQIRASRNQHKNACGGSGGETAKPVSREGDVVLHVTVPYRVVGLVVGLKGQTIKQIQQDTDTFIVTPNRDKAPIFEIRGQPESVERARMMIERHIEMRTRNCRLQDTTNIQAWSGSSPSSSDEYNNRYNGNDLHYYYSDASNQQNGHSSGLSSMNSNYSLANTGMGGVGSAYSSCTSPNFNQFTSGSPTGAGNYNSWRGYNGMLEQPAAQSGPMSRWSSATSDYTTVLGPSTQHNSFGSGGGGLQYSMSTASNGSASASPPHDLMADGSVASHLLPGAVGASVSQSSGRRISDPSADNSSYPSFPLLSNSSPTSTKGSLVLGNLFSSASTASGDASISSVPFSAPLNDPLAGGFSGSHGDFNGFSANLAGDVNGFKGHINGELNSFPCNGSSPIMGKSGSLAESTSSQGSPGSQGSPTPRVCKVCEEAEVVAALVPCGHNHFCMECAEGIVGQSTESDRKCPVCTCTAADVLRILA